VSGYELEPTYEGCRPYIEQRAVDYVQPDATWSGGLLECLSIADLAARRGVGFIPHNFSGVFGTAANYHAASIGGAALLELDRTGGPLGDLGLLLEQGWSLENGCLTAPDRPGLGLRVTEEWIEEHAIEV
jgi:L-alanine-DL-glutamate epimerase-like enolase superfamily enzyme